MAEYQITRWRELPSMVAVRDGEAVTKAQLAPRFQEAIDEAAMRLGETDSMAYLEGWTRSDWTPDAGAPQEIADRLVAELEQQWDDAALTAYLDALGPAQGEGD